MLILSRLHLNDLNINKDTTRAKFIKYFSDKTVVFNNQIIIGLLLLKPGFHKANYDHDNDQFRVKTKRLALRMTAQPYNRFAFVSWSWYLSYDGNQASDTWL